MADLTEGVNAYFYISALTIIMGGIGLMIRYSYKSKCSEVELCCIKIKRNIDVEEHEDMEEMKHPIPSSPSLQKT